MECMCYQFIRWGLTQLDVFATVHRADKKDSYKSDQQDHKSIA